MKLIGLDVWFDAEGMQADYADPAMNEDLGAPFTAMPDSSLWKKPSSMWVEW